MGKRRTRRCKSVYAKADQESENRQDPSCCPANVVSVSDTLYPYKKAYQRKKRRRPISEEDDSHWLLVQRPPIRPKPIVIKKKAPSLPTIDDSQSDVRQAASSLTVADSKAELHAQIAASVTTPKETSSPGERLDSGIESEVGIGNETMEIERWPSPIASEPSKEVSEVTAGRNEEMTVVSSFDDVETEHLQAMASLELLKSRVKELRRTKLELERTKMELNEAREEARKDMEELERRAQVTMAATVQREVNNVQKQAQKEIEAVRKESEAYREQLRKQAEEERISVEKLANSQIQTIRKQAEKELETVCVKAWKSEQAAVSVAEEKLTKKMEAMQKKMQAKLDAAERDQKKAVEDVRKESKREIEAYERKADQAVRRYNKLIAEYNILEGRISNAARFLSPTSSNDIAGRT